MAPRRISELFFEINAKTSGLQKELQSSERQLDRFGKFVIANPTATLSALGVALATMGLQATRMAEQFDGAVRKMAVNLPEGAAGVHAIKDAIGSVSDETGKLREETQALFETISKQGVSGAAEIETRARAIEKFADASNASSVTAAAGLDQLMDAFHVTADGAELALAKILSVAKGRAGVEDVLDALQTAAPTVAKFGLDYDTTLRALVQLMDGFGLSAGQAGKKLKALDKSGIEQLAKGATIAGDALKDMNDRANLAREGIDRLSNRTKNALNQSMVELGEKLLPLAISEMKDLVWWVDQLTNKSVHDTGTDIVSSVLARAANRDLPHHGAPTVAMLNQLQVGLGQMGGRGGLYRELNNDEISAFGIEKAKKVRDALQLLVDNAKNALLRDAQEAHARLNIRAIDAYFPGLDTKPTVAPGKTASTTPPGDGLPMEAAEKAKLAAAAKAAEDKLQAALKTFEETRDRLKQEQQSLESDFQTLVANMSGDAVEALKDFQRKTLEGLQSRGLMPDQLAIVAAFQASVLEVEQLSQNVGQTVAQVESAIAAGIMSDADAAAVLVGEIEKLNAEKAKLSKTDADAKLNAVALKRLTQEIGELEAKRSEHQKSTNVKIVAQTHALREQTHAVAEGLTAAASAAYGLLQVLGQGDTTLGKIVASVGQMAAGLSKATGPGGFGALSLLEKFGVGGSLIGGAIGIGAALLGESPEEKARKAALEKNTAAIQDLTAKAGLVGSINLAGNAYGAASRSARTILGQSGLEGDAKINTTGVSAADLAAIRTAAAALNITLDDTVGSYRQFVDQLLSVKYRLTEFNDDFAGQQAQLEASKKIYGDKGPATNLKDFLSIVAQSSPLFSDLARHIDTATKEGRDKLRQMVQQWFEAMKAGGGVITPELMGLAPDDFLSSLEQFIALLNEIDPAALSASEALSKIRADLNAEFEIMDTDAVGRLAKLEATYGASGGALAQLVDGLDPTTNAADIETLHARIQALFQQLQESPESVDLAGLSIDQFIAALLDLNAGVDSAASGIETAAQKFAKAADTLSVDFDVFGTDAPGQLSGTVGLYSDVGGIGAALAGLDLSTAAGRAAAITALQNLYAGDKANSDQTAGIQAILRMIRAIPEDAGEGSSAITGPVRSGAGDASRSTSGAERITVQQADRVGNLLESILVRATETATNTRTLALLDRMLRVPSFAPIHPPALSGLGGPGAGGGTVIQVRVTVVNNFNAPGAAAGAQSAGAIIGRATVDAFDKALGNRFQTARLLSGNPVAGESR